MTKRKLNRRQLWRIEKIQSEKEQRLLKNESHINALSEGQNKDTSHTRSGLVIARHGKQLEVIETHSQQTPKANDDAFLCHQRANIPAMVVGDKVIWTKLEDDENQSIGVIESLLDRTSLLARKDKHGQEKIIAANITQVFLVIACEPPTPELVIDRYLAACELLNLKVKLLVNKSDLDQSKNLLDFLKEHYLKVVDDIFTCSINNPTQLNALEEMLKNQNSVFIGQSGVGKSSLVQKLIGDQTIKTQTLSNRSGLGQHTTSTSRLYRLAKGGCIIDSPGIRDFDLDEVTLQELQKGYKEFSEIHDICKFRNCVHDHEPQCAIRNAVENNQISKLRYENYINLAKQLNLIK
jgi:ribosome biogenesis GTPase